jgi:copper/silver efflux system protein
MGTFLKQAFQTKQPTSIQEIRDATVEAGVRKVRPPLHYISTILALLPILTATGPGPDIMITMEIPLFGGMFVAIITLLTVPVLYSWIKEREFKNPR